MKYLCSCMVLVENERQQIELGNWMINIGWRVLFRKDGPCFLVAEANQGQAQWINLEGQQTREVFARDFIDCGTNIELFKALAAMNDENDREQWFTDTADDFDVCSSDRWSDEWQKENFEKYYCYWRKATAEEIIEHFNKSNR